LAGLYIHIPFCKRKCNYCNFYSIASRKKAIGFTPLLIRELELRKHFIEGQIIDTIYFGGGTPSLLEVSEILQIIHETERIFTVGSNPEITLEANPDDLNAEYLAELAQSPVNRLSIGIQSFSDKDLIFLDRIHSAAQSEKVIQIAQHAGFSDISIDLIYGIPGQQDSDWLSNLRKASAYGITHVSAYWLTVEAKTALSQLIGRGKLPAPDEEAGIRHFRLLREWAEKEGYEHYEISNLCRNQHYSRHNTAYWNGIPYLGIGPSAHSFDGKTRVRSVAGIDDYSKGILTENPVLETEELTLSDRYNEYIMTGLRTQWGVDSTHISQEYGSVLQENFILKIQPFIEQNLITRRQTSYTLTASGMLLTDFITSSLFVV